MEKFQEEIRLLAKKEIGSSDKSEQKVVTSTSFDNSALEKLYEITEKGVEAYNDVTKSELLKVYNLPFELIPLFFNFDNYRQGFVLVTTKKHIFFVINEPDLIFIYSLDSKEKVLGKNFINKASQLLKLNFSKSENKTKYFDNTGMEIEPHDVVLQVIKWGVS